MKKGFVLIELMTALFIIGVLASYFIPTYTVLLKRAKEAQCLETRKNIEKAEILYSYDHDGAFGDIDELVRNGYLNKRPKCEDGGVYVWVSTTSNILGCSVHYWPFTSTTTTNTPVGNEQMPPTPVYVFASDFNDETGLYNAVGNWVTSNGFLYATSNGANKIFFDMKESTSNLKDYKVDITATATKPYGIYYRSDGKPNANGYFFYYNGVSFAVYSSVNGKTSLIKSVSVPRGFSPYGQTHNVQIIVSGSNHSVLVDGVQYLSFTDYRYTSGTVGLYASGANGVKFDAATIENI